MRANAEAPILFLPFQAQGGEKGLGFKPRRELGVCELIGVDASFSRNLKCEFIDTRRRRI
jgi:hypothetical protein